MNAALFPDFDWRVVNATFGVGRCLSEQRRFAEAEPMLSVAEQIPETQGVPPGSYRKCIEFMIQHYTQRDESEPGRGYDDLAKEWQQKLADLR
jgi:hypothetical protein